jgi:hypothetical protein
MRRWQQATSVCIVAFVSQTDIVSSSIVRPLSSASLGSYRPGQARVPSPCRLVNAEHPVVGNLRMRPLGKPGQRVTAGGQHPGRLTRPRGREVARLPPGSARSQTSA